ncbi:MAG: HEAT repeat domain-containing protein [Candidatus Binatia bacterium]
MKTPCLYKHLRILAMASWLLCAPAVTQATDDPLLPFNTLVNQTESMAVGTVKEVSEDKFSGAQKAAISIEEQLSGRLPSSISLPGSTMDPALPNFTVGEQFLLFLKAAGKGFTPVEGAHGLIEIPAGRLPATLSLLKERLDKGSKIRLADLRDDLVVQQFPAAAVLLGSVLEEMTQRLLPEEAPLVADIACNKQQEFPSAVQTWALYRVGPLKVAEARECVEAILTTKENGAASIAAAETLGNLKDPRSLPALLSVLATYDQPSDDENDDDGDGGLRLAVVLAIGKIGDATAVPALQKLAQNGDDLALHSTAVHALGLIGPKSIDALTEISKAHPSSLIRDQAQRTLERVQKNN